MTDKSKVTNMTGPLDFKGILPIVGIAAILAIKPELNCFILRLSRLIDARYTVNSETFARILFSQKTLKHICDVKNSRLGQDCK